MLVSGKKRILFSVIFCILLISWCVFIFSMSARTRSESSSISSSLLSEILEKISSEYREADDAGKEVILERYHEFFRKCAHFFEYFVLWILAFLFIDTLFTKKFYSYIMAFLFVVCYSCTDEIHQYFVPGRGCKLFDVFVDSLGAVIAILLFLFIVGIRKLRKKSRA